MTTPVIGQDCDVIFIHPDVNDGNPYGFVLTPDPSKSGSSFSVQRKLGDDQATTGILIYFTIILADDLKNPDGSEHADSRSTMYDMLLDYMENLTGLSIDTVIGTYVGLGQFGHTLTELHLVEATFESLKFANIDTYHPPIESSLFYGSLWQDDPPAAGAFTWETSVWR